MKTFIGTVVSNKMVKSVLVSVARWKVFPKYKVRKRWTKKFMAHDEENKCNMGDTVRINMSRISSRYVSSNAAICSSFKGDTYQQGSGTPY
ncbi:hypothetical protein WJX79_008836 [Trebouxia sp. C0005]